MVTAMAYPDLDKRGRGNKSGLNPDFIDADKSYINKARYVLRNNFTPDGQKYPDRCLAVMAAAIYPSTPSSYTTLMTTLPDKGL